MARKLYRTKKDITSLLIQLVISPKADGKPAVTEYVEFTGGIMSPSWKPSTFMTESSVIQDRLEKHPAFNLRFELAKTFEDNKEIVIKKVETKSEEHKVVEAPKAAVKVPQVKTVSGAINKLINEGASPDGLDTYEDVLRVAKEMNVEFPNLKAPV